MSEETKTPEEQKLNQQYVFNTDQQVSVNAFIEVDVNGEMVRFQVTNRYGAKAEKIVATVKAAIDAYRIIREANPLPVAKVPQASSEPVRVAIGDDGNKLPDIFKGRAGRLSVEMKDNKYSFKIEDAQFHPGRKGSKFGVRVWDEVLTAAGLNIEPGQPVPDISGIEFEYIENDKGYPYKVTRLIFPH